MGAMKYPFCIKSASRPHCALLLGTIVLVSTISTATSAEQLTPERSALGSHLRTQMESLDEKVNMLAERARYARRQIDEQGTVLNERDFEPGRPQRRQILQCEN
jgi:hypothetical protein